MSITTCQKVTLISCSVLCISLFLPRMFLPRAKTEMGQPQVGPGFHPSVIHQMSLQEDSEQWAVDPLQSLTHGAGTKVKFKGRAKKYNLMSQVIPIYGFGILLYILYIIYKLTCRGKPVKSGNNTTYSTAHFEHKSMTDHELARLQERLRQTERMMERVVTAKARGSGSGRRRKSKTSTSKKEEKLLRQLRQITQLIQEGRLEGASPEMEAEEVPYGADWEGYPEETYPEYEENSDKHDKYRFDMMSLEGPTKQPTAEALAERMEQEEEEVMARKLSIVKEEDEEEREEEEEEGEDNEEDEDEDVIEEDTEEEEEEEEAEAERRQLLTPTPSLPTGVGPQERLGFEVSKELQGHTAGRKQISFSEHKDVFRYPKEDANEEEEEGEEEEEEEVEREDEAAEESEGTEVEEEEVEGEVEVEDEDDPVMEAESLLFGCEGSSNPEEEAEEGKEEYLLMSVSEEGEGHVQADVPTEVRVSGLRMRTRRET